MAVCVCYALSRVLETHVVTMCASVQDARQLSEEQMVAKLEEKMTEMMNEGGFGLVEWPLLLVHAKADTYWKQFAH